MKVSHVSLDLMGLRRLFQCLKYRRTRQEDGLERVGMDWDKIAGTNLIDMVSHLQ